MSCISIAYLLLKPSLIIHFIVHSLGLILHTFPIYLMDILFLLVLSANLLAVAAVIFSINYPERQIWPPPSKSSWEYWFILLVDGVCTLGVPTVGYLDRGSLGFGSPIMTLIGIFLVLISFPLIVWAVFTLSWRQSFGLKGSLVTTGPYRFSRNPQYLGFLLLYTGIFLLLDSVKYYVLGGFFMLFILLAPFSEEIWLRKEFGEEYEEYLERVPRFFGTKSIRLLTGSR